MSEHTVDPPAAEREPDHVTPEPRTVGLEVLTDELREQAESARTALGGATGGRVGLVCRIGPVVAIAEVDETFTSARRSSTDVLVAMLQAARVYANEGDAELLMPGADVLAALDGRDPGLWTGWVPVVYRTVQPGWQVMTMPSPPAEPTPALVADTASCSEPQCANGADCSVLVLPDGPVHRESWRSVHVRIPASVTL